MVGVAVAEKEALAVPDRVAVPWAENEHDAVPASAPAPVMAPVEAKEQEAVPARAPAPVSRPVALKVQNPVPAMFSTRTPVAANVHEAVPMIGEVLPPENRSGNANIDGL